MWGVLCEHEHCTLVSPKQPEATMGAGTGGKGRVAELGG